MTTRALAVVLKINRPIDLTNDSFNPAKSWFVHIPVLFPCGRSEILPLLCLPELPDQPKQPTPGCPGCCIGINWGNVITQSLFFSHFFSINQNKIMYREENVG